MYFKITWNDWYMLAQAYYNYYGNLNIRQDFKTNNGYDYSIDGYNLGVWLNNQHGRYRQGLLTEEQKKKLELLGVDFEKTHASRWNKMYKLAEIYYRKNGHLKITQSFRTLDGITHNENGEKLGVWLNDQRASYKNGKLSKIRIEKLKAVGAILENVREDNWIEMYKLAKSFYEFYGHLKIPVKFITLDGVKYNSEGKKLGLWISTQRKFYLCKKLSQEHINALKEIDMIFEEVYDKEWERVYNLAKAYYEHYGHLKVKRDFKTKDGFTYDEAGYPLHNWLDAQKAMYRKKKLSEEKLKKLELIGIVFEVRKNKEVNISLCFKYGIDYQKNKRVVDSIPYKEFLAKINYLNSLQIPLVINQVLHPIFSTGNMNMQIKYGISLEELLLKYSNNKQFRGNIK